MIGRLNEEDERKFRRWVSNVALDVSAAKLPEKVERLLVDFLSELNESDQVLGLANAYLSGRLRSNYIRAVVVLDGTVCPVTVGEDGEPLEGASA